MSRWIVIGVALAAGGGIPLAMAGAVWLSARGENDCSREPGIYQVHADVRTLTDCVDLYQIDKGRWPTVEEGLQAVIANGKCKANVKDPWGHPYQYRPVYSDGTVVRFEVSSVGGQESRECADGRN